MDPNPESLNPYSISEFDNLGKIIRFKLLTSSVLEPTKNGFRPVFVPSSFSNLQSKSKLGLVNAYAFIFHKQNVYLKLLSKIRHPETIFNSQWLKSFIS